jgi:hypothetical protein
LPLGYTRVETKTLVSACLQKFIFAFRENFLTKIYKNSGKFEKICQRQPYQSVKGAKEETPQPLQAK